MTASSSNAAPVLFANRREKNGFRRRGGSLTALLLGSAVLLSPMAAHAQALDLAGVSQSVANRSGAGNVTNTGGAATLNFDVAASSFAMTGSIVETAGQITIIKNLAGRQDFNAHNTYTGGTTVNDGVLGFGFGDSFGTGALTLNGGEILATGVDLNVANDINIAANSKITANSTTLSGTITGAGVLRKTGSSFLTFTGINTGFTGGLNVGSGTGGGVVLVGEHTLGGGAIDSLGGAAATFTTTTAARLGMAAGTTTATLSNMFAISGGLLTIQTNTGADVLTLNGTISGSAGIWLKVNPGTVVFNGNNAGYTGSTTVEGGTIQVGDNNALGTTATATVQIKQDSTLKAGVGGLTIANKILIGSAGNRILTVDTNGNDMTMSGAINNATGSNKGALVKTGAGTLTLTSTASTYSLGTTINGGTLSVNQSANLGLTAPLDFNGGTLQITGTTYNSTSRPITFTGNGGFDIDNVANTFNLANPISGAGGLNKLGAGTLQLSAANTFTGNSSVSAGTLILSNAQGFGTAGTVTLAGGELRAGNAGLDLTRDITLAGGSINTNGNTFTLSGTIGGAGDLVKNSSGTLVLTNSGNSYSGDTKVNGGKVQADANDVFGNGSLRFGSGTTLVAGAASVTFGNDVYVANATTFDTGANTLTLNGVVQDNGPGGAVNKDGSGTLILTNSNT